MYSKEIRRVDMISQNKNVNRLFLAVVVIYIGVSFGFGFLTAFIPALSELPMYVSLFLCHVLCIAGGNILKFGSLSLTGKLVLPLLSW